MSEHAGHVLILSIFGLIVVFKIVFVKWRLWNLPLEHGPGYFLGVPVAPDFYDGPGARWLRRYRVVVLAEHLIFVTLLIGFIALGHWNQLPLLAPIDVALYFGMIGGPLLWARRVVGVPPPRLQAMAVTLEPRRLAHYISWPVEGLMAALLAGSWGLLYDTGWRALVVETYIVMGLLPIKFSLIRNRVPLPPDRPEEHHQWLDAMLRFNLRQIDLMRWLFLVVLAGYALFHGWPGAARIAGLRWLVVAIGLGVWLGMAVVFIRDGRRLAVMGRGLRPPSSWRRPFNNARPAQIVGRVLSIAYFAGLVVMVMLSRN